MRFVLLAAVAAAELLIQHALEENEELLTEEFANEIRDIVIEGVNESANAEVG